MPGGAEGFAGTERFQVRRCLGTGGFGTVYEAFDRKRSASVALKVLKDTGASQVYRFKQEFRALSGLSHPNLVTLYELVSEGDLWFFSMELVKGSDFLGFVGDDGDDALLFTPPTDAGQGSATVASLGEVPPAEEILAGDPTRTEDALPGTLGPSGATGPGEEPPATPSTPPPRLRALSPRRLVGALRQLVEGLDALHRAGKVHRDIKPANVLCTREGRVVILDFGILRDLSPDRGESTKDLSGTPFYMAPEQVQEATVTEAADWYSVGVLLYQALTGALPFSGPALQVLRKKMTQDPAPPSRLRPDAPPALGALCMRLLDRDPARRPGSEQILAALADLEVQLGADAPEAPPPVNHALHPETLFIGRREQLGSLFEAYEASLRGQAAVALCRGGSGAGKSTLCRRFLQELAGREGRVVALTGRCFEHEDVPFKALDGAIDALSRFLRRPHAEVDAVLPRDAFSLARLFPVLLQVPAIKEAPGRRIADDTQVRHAAFLALRELLLRLSDRRPVVLHIDDLQWGDLDSVSLLLELLRPPEPPPLLLLLSYRSDEEASSAALQALRRGLAGELGRGVALREVEVGELPGAEAEELARALLPGIARERAAAIAAEARGNAFFVAELSRSFASLPAAREEGATLDAVLRARASRLPEAARRLLEVVAVAGQPVPRAAAAAAAFAGAPELSEPQALATLRSERLVRVRHTQDPLARAAPREELLAYHDRVREAVTASLPAQSQGALHLKLARALEATGTAEPERLVFHLLRGGDQRGAARQAAEASAQAARALAYHQTVRLCQAALGTGELPEESRLEVEARLADALVGVGRPKDAADAYLALAERGPASLALERRRKAARQFFSGGYLDEGRQVLGQILGAARVTMPQSPAALFLSLVFYRTLLALRGFAFRERSEAEVPAADLLRIDTCEAIVSVAANDALLSTRFVLVMLWHALKAGEPRRVALGLSSLSLVRCALGEPRDRYIEQLTQAKALAERLGDPYAIGHTTCLDGHSANLEGRWKDSTRLLLRAEETLKADCLEASTQLNFIAILCPYNLRWMGELRQLEGELTPRLKEATEAGRRSLEASLRLMSAYLLPLRDDDPAQAAADIEATLASIADQSFNLLHIFAIEATLMTLLYQGEGARAWQLFREKYPEVARSGQLRVAFFEAIWLQLSGLVGLAGGQPPARAERLASKLARGRPLFAAPAALLLRALAARARGDAAAALALIEQAEQGFAACDMGLHAAAARLRRGRWLGGEQGQALEREAAEWMALRGVRAPGRMAAMLAPG